MWAIKKIVKREDVKDLHIPEEMGEYIEIIIFPANVANEEEKEGYFEIITEKGKNIEVPDWTEEEWNEAVLHSLQNAEDDNENWEDTFDVKKR